MKLPVKKNHLRLAWKNFITFVFILVFINLYSFAFGQANLLTGVAVVTGLSMFRDVDLGISPRQGALIVLFLYPYLGAAAYLSQFSIWAAIPIHFISLYLLMLLTSAPLLSKAYMPFLLCYVFAQGNPVWGREAALRIAGLFISGVAISIVYYTSHRKKQQKRSIQTLIAEIPLPSVRNDFIFRITIGVSLAMIAGALLHAAKPMWISIVAMSLTQPFVQDTHSRILWRAIATVVGTVLFLFLFQFLIPPEYSTWILMLLSYIYTFISEYRIQQIFVTINALSAAVILFHTSVAIPMRILFLAIGIIIVLLVKELVCRVIHPLVERRMYRQA